MRFRKRNPVVITTGRLGEQGRSMRRPCKGYVLALGGLTVGCDSP